MKGQRAVAVSLTEAQERALAVEGASVALSAGAGCGKTKVLSERFLRHLGGPEPRALGQIVALTFTEKAARELRERVRAACRLMLEKGEDVPYWRSILRGLEAAPIGTFHAFCGQILRRFPIEAGVEPGFAILEESIAPSLRERALNRCMRNWLAERRPELVALAADLGLDRVREALADLVDARSRGDLRPYTEQAPEETVRTWEALWNEDALPKLLAGFVSSTQSCLTLLRENPCQHAKMSERRAFLLEHLPAIPEAAGLGAWLESLNENARVQGGGSAKDWSSPAVYERVKQEMEAVRGAIKKLQAKLDWDRTASLSAAEQGRRFARLGLGAIDAYENEKGAEGMLDFDDLQLKVLNLLRHGPAAVRDQLYRDITLFLVDEFQDTDPTQGEILRHLVGDRFAHGSLFVVGDIKQSIYRFRGAQPAIFAEFRQGFPPEGWASLTENFRSVPPLLAFANALFANTFEGEEHLLKPGPGTKPGDKRPAVEFLWAHEEDDDDQKISVDTRRKTEARWLARLIAQRIGDKQWQVRDGKTKQLRPATAGDIALLFRTLNDAAAYEAALVAEGIDYHIVGGSAFFGQQEVLDVINLLSAIEDPFDALALAATLRGPFGCVSDDGLYWLATSPPGDLTTGLENWNRIPELSAEDRRRAGRLHELLLRWRRAKDRGPIAALLDRALDDSGYEAALMGEFLGPRKRANVRKLVRIARRFDEQGGFTLADFVAKLRADLRKPPREEQAATTDEEGDTVRLMTIHQAKGLEFPIVVVPDLNRDAPRTTKTVVFHPQLGVLAQPSEDDLPLGEEDGSDESPGKSLGLMLFRHREEAEEEAEALRLFYVAVTRAQDVLVLSAGMSPGEEPKSPAMELLAARFDRTTGACLADLPAAWPRPEILVNLKRPGIGSNRPKGSRARPKLLTVANTIRATTAATAERAVERTAKRPRRFVLDPAETLSGTSARLDRLVRTILADPRVFDREQRDNCIHRAARVQSPVASPQVVDTARAWVEAWLETPDAQQIADAPEIHCFVPWTVAWPRSAADPTVYQGTIDFLYRDSKGHWSLLSLAGPDQPEARERLRCLLSVHAARDLSIKKIRRVCRARFGPDPVAVTEAHLDANEIERAIRIVLCEPRLPGF